MPQLLNPGPLASKVTFFAPLSLLFFFFVVAILAAVQHREIHPMHYLLLGCAFFAFHLLFAYLVDHVALVPSFVIASLVSLFLVISYARLFVGWRFALREMGLANWSTWCCSRTPSSGKASPGCPSPLAPSSPCSW